MIRWCAYCQSFLGESAPYESFDISHGICLSCVQLKRTGNLDIDKMSKIGLFYVNARSLVQAGEIRMLKAAIEDELAHTELAPFDLFMGIVQPLLFEVGELWSQGKLSVSKENEFTNFAEGLLSEIILQSSESKVKSPPQSTLDALLLCAPDNSHTIGIRALSTHIQQLGLSTKFYYPGLPALEVLELIRQEQPCVLGISVSMPEQKNEVQKTVELIESSNLIKPSLILVGGSDIKYHCEHWLTLQSQRVRVLFSDLESLRKELEPFLKNGVPDSVQKRDQTKTQNTSCMERYSSSTAKI